MKFVRASKLHRKSGVRLGEPGAPVRFPPGLWVPEGVLLESGGFLCGLSQLFVDGGVLQG
jgi:hypothetical protein